MEMGSYYALATFLFSDVIYKIVSSKVAVKFEGRLRQCWVKVEINLKHLVTETEKEKSECR